MYERLHLRVNKKKTEVGSMFGRKFLGYCRGRWSGDRVKTAVAPKAIDTFKPRIRGHHQTCRGHEHGAGCCTHAGIPAGLESVFPACIDAYGVQSPRFMDSAPAAGLSTQTVANGDAV